MDGLGRRTAVLVVVATTLFACATPAPSTTPSPTPVSGGTLRIGTTGGPDAVRAFAYADPGLPTIGALLKCCLARTLLTYPGRPTAEGGTTLEPDLASGPPLVSRDGLTWTFHLRRGIRYAPPFENTEVVAADVIRAAERSVRLSPDSAATADAPFWAVAGAAEYGAGSATTIRGLESPDTYTLVVRLTHPWGGFGTAVADVSWSPIPEVVGKSHDADMGWNWVSTGPYMFEHYPANPSAPTATLIRNPSWDRATDARRGAWVDRIEIASAGSLEEAVGRVERGEFDLLDAFVTGEIVARWQDDPSLSKQLAVTLSEYIFYLPMNLAVPPFDDVAVRRAVNFAIDRAALRDPIRRGREAAGAGPQRSGVVATHVFADSLTGGLLLSYDPFPSPGGRGDLAQARDQMSRSRYDHDGDGRCDDPVCTGVILPAFDPTVGAIIRDALAPIGIEAQVVGIDDRNDMGRPENHTALQANPFGWGYGLTGTELAFLVHGGPGLADPQGGTFNFSLVGASPEQLRGWGYAVTSIPGVDDVIDACDATIGHVRAQCWAQLDQIFTATIVPWVPIYSVESGYVTSSRVTQVPLDQGIFGSFPALDQVVLQPGSLGGSTVAPSTGAP
jgi:ABC-type transport system substrate-binding protein